MSFHAKTSEKNSIFFSSYSLRLTSLGYSPRPEDNTDPSSVFLLAEPTPFCFTFWATQQRFLSFFSCHATAPLANRTSCCL